MFGRKVSRPSRKRLAAGVATATVVICVSASASAVAQAVDTFDVTANVVEGCLITANDLDFGDYTSITVLDGTATSTIQVDCSVDVSFQVALNEGDSGGDFTSRLMSNGADTLTYNLFKDPTHLTVWGDASGLTENVSDVSLGSPIDYTVYGVLDAGQDVSTGAYSDTVTATVTF